MKQSEENATFYAHLTYKNLDNFIACITLDEFLDNEAAIRVVQTMLHKHM